MSQLFIHHHGTRTRVASFKPFLRESLHRHILMDPDLIDREARTSCRWVGWGISKGVTHRFDDVSVLAVPNELKRGLHGDLIQGFDRVDPPELCYERDAPNGFG